MIVDNIIQRCLLVRVLRVLHIVLQEEEAGRNTHIFIDYNGPHVHSHYHGVILSQLNLCLYEISSQRCIVDTYRCIVAFSGFHLFRVLQTVSMLTGS